MEKEIVTKDEEGFRKGEKRHRKNKGNIKKRAK
jgi:hypothetical protein